MEDEDEDDETIKIISMLNFDYEQPNESYSDSIEKLKTWQPSKTNLNQHAPYWLINKVKSKFFEKPPLYREIFVSIMNNIHDYASANKCFSIRDKTTLCKCLLPIENNNKALKIVTNYAYQFGFLHQQKQDKSFIFMWRQA